MGFVLQACCMPAGHLPWCGAFWRHAKLCHNKLQAAQGHNFHADFNENFDPRIDCTEMTADFTHKPGLSLCAVLWVMTSRSGVDAELSPRFPDECLAWLARSSSSAACWPYDESRPWSRHDRDRQQLLQSCWQLCTKHLVSIHSFIADWIFIPDSGEWRGNVDVEWLKQEIHHSRQLLESPSHRFVGFAGHG